MGFPNVRVCATAAAVPWSRLGLDKGDRGQRRQGDGLSEAGLVDPAWAEVWAVRAGGSHLLIWQVFR